MTNSVTLIADHKGFTKPKVLGDEYVVLADVTITANRTGTTATAAAQTIAQAANGTLTRTAGNFNTDGFESGDIVALAGGKAANNQLLLEVTSVAANGLSLIAADNIAATAVQAEAGSGDEVLTHAGELITAASLGLKTITSATIVGQNQLNLRYVVTRTKNSGTGIYLITLGLDPFGGNEGLLAIGNATAGTIRLQVQGNL
tara:strand:- start:1978 stop:2583 length:606 start_codon:yes stop_codon:yes gene_type:complete